MTTDQETLREKRFASDLLPWIVAGGALVLYLLTLSHWITGNSLIPYARLAGLQWYPALSNPLYHLLTLPLKLLPLAWLPVAMSLFSALCASLVLLLLARAVALLPHDRTHPQRLVEHSEEGLLTIRSAWMPVVFAGLVCALQFTFWERATSGGPEMLDVLLFAYTVRCLLEYRHDARESWLLKAVFAYAVGMTENWLHLLLLPGFLASLIWFMGFSFFNTRFLTRAWLLALAGLSFYFLLPLLAVLQGDSDVGFWQSLRFILAEQKNSLMTHWNMGRDRMALAALPALIPVFIMGLKFQSFYGDSSRLGTGLATFSLHVLHAAFLVVCGWVAIDPPFSASQLGLGAQFLPLHFLTALGFGYFAGYFLLLFGERAKAFGQYRDLVLNFNRTIVAAVWVFALVVVAGLVYRNYEPIHAGNGQVLRRFGELLTRNLPSKPAVLLSDDPRRLWLVQAILAGRPDAPKHLPVDTRLLPTPDYHRTLHKLSGGTWPLLPTNSPGRVEDLTIADRVLKQASARDVYYLHPSFGYYFEFLRAEPHGLAYKLVPYATNEVLRPPLSAAVLQENLEFWKQFETEDLPRTLALEGKGDAPASTNLFTKLLERARIKERTSLDALASGSLYSRPLNQWAVELQRLNRLSEAGERFAQALKLNPRNVVARINLEFNRTLIAGTPASVKITRSIEDQFEGYRSWDQVLSENGSFDEPTFCYEQGVTFARNSLYRQALDQFTRVSVLSPSDVLSRLWLANIYLLSRLPDRALAVVDEVQSDPGRFALTASNRVDFLLFKAAAHFSKGEAITADRLLQTAIAREGTNTHLLAASAQLYLQNGRLTNTLALLERLRTVLPGDISCRLQLASLCLGDKQFSRALSVVDEIKSHPERSPAGVSNQVIALAIQASALYGQEKGDEAGQLLEDALKRDPDNNFLLASCAQVYMQHNRLTNALSLLNEQLRREPDDPQVLMNRGYVCLQSGAYADALTSLNRLLELQPGNYLALLNRAIANLQSARYDDAQKDYQTLYGFFPEAFQIQYGLGEIAWRRKDTNTAIRCYERYLTLAPTNSAESQTVVDRLQQLKTAAP